MTTSYEKMADEPQKSPTGPASGQDTTTAPSQSASTTSTTTASEPEPASIPTPTSISKEDSLSPVPPPPQPQPFPTPYTGHSTAWTGQSAPPPPVTNNSNDGNNNHSAVPPPPKASEMHLFKSTSTTKPAHAHIDTQSHTQPHNQPQQQYTPFHRSGFDQANMPNLEHPPGYRQNPVIAQPSHATLASDGAGLGDSPHFGMRQVWDPAPGEAGGRYVYEYDFFDDGVRSGQEGVFGGYGQSQGQGGQEEEWIWNSAAGVWEATVSWMKSAGEKMAEMEEGVWRWVNGR